MASLRWCWWAGRGTGGHRSRTCLLCPACLAVSWALTLHPFEPCEWLTLKPPGSPACPGREETGCSGALQSSEHLGL